MRISFLLGGAVGYVLGARAGRERYESIVAMARRFGGSQTVQSAAGVMQAQVDELAQRVREVVAGKVSGSHSATAGHNGTGRY